MNNNITINGKDYAIGFDFASLLEIEEITGKSFTEINNENRRENLQFIYGALKSFNDWMPPFNQWLHELTSVADIATVNEALAPHITAFFKIPGIAESHVADNSDEESTEEKNA